jgi:hypothetical protein
MKMDSLSRILPAFALTFALGFGPVHASFAADEKLVVPNASQPTPEPPAAPGPNVSLPSMDEEVTILRDDYAGKYNRATLENLSKLYWRLGAFDFEDDLAIGNYLKINDCKIFTEYLNDDLEWKEIVRVMKAHLKEHSATFPLNYQFLLELHLGRYDTERGGFALVDKTGFIDAKRIEVDSIDANRDVCFDAGTIKDYPKSIVILLPQPFTLDFVKMDEHVAQAYILRKKSEYSKLSDERRVRAYERDAYLRLRVTFSQYHGNLRGEQNQTMAILFGTIDGYEIFEDNGQKRLMVSVDLKKEQEKSAAESSMMSRPVEQQAGQKAVESADAPSPERESPPAPVMGIAPVGGDVPTEVPATP